MAAKKENVTIALHRSSDSIPLFLSGTFTNPQWQPVKLTVKRPPQSEDWIYSRKMKLSPGQYQYKFCEGEGDDAVWFHDEGAKQGKTFTEKRKFFRWK